MQKTARFMLPALLLLGLAFGAGPANGQAGSLDPTFGVAGQVVTSFGQNSIVPHDAALQSDGKLLVVGFLYFYEGAIEVFAVVRYCYNPMGRYSSAASSARLPEPPSARWHVTIPTVASIQASETMAR